MNRPLAEMFRYNRWANLVLLEACRALPNEQLDARDPGASEAPPRRVVVRAGRGLRTGCLSLRGLDAEHLTVVCIVTRYSAYKGGGPNGAAHGRTCRRLH